MPRKTKQERIDYTLEKALELGLPISHAEVLAKISFRKNLDTRVCYLMEQLGKGYRNMIATFKEMSDDPTAFYYKHKSSRYEGHKKFSRYGNLSSMYSHASPIQLICVLLEDAKEVRDQAKIMRILYGEVPRGEEYNGINFGDLRLKKLERALRQDLTGNGMPEDLTERLLKELKWDEPGGFASSHLPREHIMDAFYVFFSSSDGDRFLEDWQDISKRDKLVDQFTYRVYNDPRINPHLIHMTPQDIGNPKFEENCRTFGDEPVSIVKGSKIREVKRSDIDARQDYMDI